MFGSLGVIFRLIKYGIVHGTSLLLPTEPVIYSALVIKYML